MIMVVNFQLLQNMFRPIFGMRVDGDDSNPGPSQLLRVALASETFLGGVELVRN